MAAGFDARIGETADRARDQIDAWADRRPQPGTRRRRRRPHGRPTPSQSMSGSPRRGAGGGRRLRDQAPGVAATITDGARAAWSVPMGHAYLVVGVVTLVGAAVLCWITPNRIDATAGGAAMADGSATSADQDGDNAEDRHESDRPANVGDRNTNSPGFSGV